MNAAELSANPAATSRVVHDLNADPTLPFPDGHFEAVTCCVSVDYLTRPVEVFAAAARVLTPGGLMVVTFSNRCFPTKAIHGWLTTDDDGRVRIVREYFHRSGRFEPVRGCPVHPGGNARRSPLRRLGGQTVVPTRALIAPRCLPRPNPSHSDGVSLRNRGRRTDVKGGEPPY